MSYNKGYTPKGNIVGWIILREDKGGVPPLLVESFTNTFPFHLTV